jgi:hypothetical protein
MYCDFSRTRTPNQPPKNNKYDTGDNMQTEARSSTEKNKQQTEKKNKVKSDNKSGKKKHYGDRKTHINNAEMQKEKLEPCQENKLD